MSKNQGALVDSASKQTQRNRPPEFWLSRSPTAPHTLFSDSGYASRTSSHGLWNQSLQTSSRFKHPVVWYPSSGLECWEPQTLFCVDPLRELSKDEAAGAPSRRPPKTSPSPSQVTPSPRGRVETNALATVNVYNHPEVERIWGIQENVVMFFQRPYSI